MGKNDLAEPLLKKFSQTFKLGKAMHGPGTLKFFGINSMQRDEFTFKSNADDKLQDIFEHLFTHDRRRQTSSTLNPIEQKSYASIKDL